MAERRDVGTLVDVVLTVDAREAFQAVAGNGGRFRQVSTRPAILTSVIHGAVVDRGFADGTIEAVGALASEAVGEVDARAPIDAGRAQAFVDILACQVWARSNFCKKDKNMCSQIFIFVLFFQSIFVPFNLKHLIILFRYPN